MKTDDKMTWRMYLGQAAILIGLINIGLSAVYLVSGRWDLALYSFWGALACFPFALLFAWLQKRAENEPNPKI
jgi:hypothetical protein